MCSQKFALMMHGQGHILVHLCNAHTQAEYPVALLFFKYIYVYILKNVYIYVYIFVCICMYTQIYVFFLF